MKYPQITPSPPPKKIQIINERQSPFPRHSPATRKTKLRHTHQKKKIQPPGNKFPHVHLFVFPRAVACCAAGGGEESRMGVGRGGFGVSQQHIYVIIQEQERREKKQKRDHAWPKKNSCGLEDNSFIRCYVGHRLWNDSARKAKKKKQILSNPLVWRLIISSPPPFPFFCHLVRLSTRKKKKGVLYIQNLF